MKEHISTNVGIYAGIYGAQIISNNYNNETGTIYCNDSSSTPVNHAVTIIGWDNNYDKSNFNENCRPTNNGAWIIKNSWGTELTEDLLNCKTQIYNAYTADCNNNGWNSPELIPNDFIINYLQSLLGNKVSIDKEKNLVILKIGNDGYMYISYDDVNVYTSLSGIQKASAKKDYYNLYQNDIIGPSRQLFVNTNEVYINPNGS